MGFVKEFREFALKGNVMDLAVGVIIGGAFGTIVNSVINDLVMPLVAFATRGGVDWSNRYISLSDKIPAGAALADARKLGPVLAYGSFITVALNFVILAFCIFLMIKAVNRLKRQPPPAPAVPPPPTKDQMLLTEIRDALRAGR